jgi:hypothetical protein
VLPGRIDFERPWDGSMQCVNYSSEGKKRWILFSRLIEALDIFDTKLRNNENTGIPRQYIIMLDRYFRIQ